MKNHIISYIGKVAVSCIILVFFLIGAALAQEDSQKGIRIYGGYASLPLKISGFEDAYLNDYSVSGEGGGSEAAWVPYSEANGTASSGILLGFGYAIAQVPGLEGVLDFTSISGNATGTLLTFGASYSFPVMKNLLVVASPKFASGSVSRTMGTLPFYNGQVNVPEGDFITGDEIKMEASGSGFVLEGEVRYVFMKNFDAFFSLGLSQVSFGKPKVTIAGTEVKSNVHSRSCTGNSSVDLSCSDYFDPFGSAKTDMSGIKIGLGVGYVF